MLKRARELCQQLEVQLVSMRGCYLDFFLKITSYTFDIKAIINVAKILIFAIFWPDKKEKLQKELIINKLISLCVSSVPMMIVLC